MAAFADALDLRTALIEYSDSPDLVEVFPRIIQLVEADINRRLRRVGQMVSTTITIASGEGTLPSGFSEMIGLYDAHGNEYVQVPVAQVRPNGYYYAIGVGKLLTSLLTGTLDMDYYANPASIADSLTDTNETLTTYPNLYFFGGLVEAGRYLRNEGLVAAYLPQYEREYMMIRADEQSKRYARARVRLNQVTP